MRIPILVGMIVSLAIAVAAFGAGLLLSGYLAVASGAAWVVVAGRHARPSRWEPAEGEHDRRSHHG